MHKLVVALSVTGLLAAGAALSGPASATCTTGSVSVTNTAAPTVNVTPQPSSSPTTQPKGLTVTVYTADPAKSTVTGAPQPSVVLPRCPKPGNP